jgi:lipopolysaccharide transport system ATP-binding protein
MSDTAIKIKNLSKVYKLYDRNIDRLKEAVNPFKKKYYRPFYALKNINLTIKKGEILGVIGRNGAGKSTLLKIITGVLTPTGGSCIVSGKISPLLGLSTGFNPELTGLENIYLNGTIKGFSKKEMDSRLDNILSFAEIGEYIKQPVKTYSSGMSARLGFAVAINIDPEILIIDEVLSVGDELFKRKCYAKMEELFNTGCTVLYVSHAIDSINDICSQAILIDRGEQILEGLPKLVTAHYLKYLYAKPEDKISTRNKIIRLNKDEKRKEEFSANISPVDTKTVPEEKELPRPENKTTESRQRAFYIPNFNPKSTVVTKNIDVDIFDMHIRTLDGKKVNALVTHEEYIYSYKVKFGMPVEIINFGMGIKSEKGIPLSWMIYPGVNRYLDEKIQKGDSFCIDWRFKCLLHTGNYFIDSGLRSKKNEEIIILAKISDAVAFKVQSGDSKSKQKGGIFDPFQYVEINKF